MGWADLFHKHSSHQGAREKQSAADSPESLVTLKWNELVRGIEQEVEEFGRLHKKPDFKQASDFQYRISNSEIGVALLLTADIPAGAIHYEYEAEEKNVPVPEGGFLSLRTVACAVALYSADQQLTTEQARRMILEPLLFPPTAPSRKPAGNDPAHRV
jgi:hypothetical protein